MIFNSQCIEKMTYKDDYNHILTIKLIPNSKKKCKHANIKLFTVCYRSPDSQNTEFITHFSKILSLIQKTNKRSYIVGDLNYNLLNLDHH